MRYVMKQKLLSWGDDFYIQRRVRQRDVLRRRQGDQPRATSSRSRTCRGDELAFISRSCSALGPTYEIYRDGELAAVVKKALFTLLHRRFTVDVPGPDDLEARGDFTRPRVRVRPGATGGGDGLEALVRLGGHLRRGDRRGRGRRADSRQRGGGGPGAPRDDGKGHSALESPLEPDDEEDYLRLAQPLGAAILVPPGSVQ